MGTGTLIEWCHRPGTVPTTLNVSLGCRKRSAACDHCFALYSVVRQQHTLPMPVVVTGPDGDLDWTGDVILMAKRLEIPLSWRDPRTVFVNDLSDLFDQGVPYWYVALLWTVMWRTSRPTVPGRGDRPVHTFMALTKNPARMRFFTHGWADPARRAAWLAEAAERGPAVGVPARVLDHGDPALMDPVLPNVWCGVSAEDQGAAEVRIPILLDTLGAVLYISAEPLLGAMNLRRLKVRGRVINALRDGGGEPAVGAPRVLDWVITGGETKKGARPARAEWVRTLRDQCLETGTAFFMKQWGDWAPCEQMTPAAAVVAHRDNPPGDTPHSSHRVGKRLAGAAIDGVEYRQFPA